MSKHFTFGGGFHKLSIFLQRSIAWDNLQPSEELDNHAGGDNGGNTKFHQGTAVGGQDHTHPVEWVIPLRSTIRKIKKYLLVPYKGIWEQRR